MDLNEYQKQAMRTRADAPRPDRLGITGLGLTGEAGEVADIIKKHLFHDHPLDAAKLRAELGDVLWYLAYACDTMGFTLEDVAQGNLDKLRARYPDGFDPERSLNRPDDNP